MVYSWLAHICAHFNRLVPLAHTRRFTGNWFTGCRIKRVHSHNAALKYILNVHTPYYCIVILSRWCIQWNTLHTHTHTSRAEIVQKWFIKKSRTVAVPPTHTHSKPARASSLSSEWHRSTMRDGVHLNLNRINMLQITGRLSRLIRRKVSIAFRFKLNSALCSTVAVAIWGSRIRDVHTYMYVWYSLCQVDCSVHLC